MAGYVPFRYARVGGATNGFAAAVLANPTRLARSRNLTSWTTDLISDQGTYIGSDYSTITTGRGLAVAFYNYDPDSLQYQIFAATSPDGGPWRIATVIEAATGFQGIADFCWSGTRFLLTFSVYDQDSRQYRLCAATSTDGSSWNVSVIVESDYNYYSYYYSTKLVWSGAKFVKIFYYYDKKSQKYQYCAATSTDGSSWNVSVITENVYNYYYYGAWSNSLAWSGTTFMATFYIYDQDSREYRFCAATSTDGSSWNVTVISERNNIYYSSFGHNLAWYGTTFLATFNRYDPDSRQYRLCAATSTDGGPWRIATVIEAATGFQGIADFCWSGTRFLLTFSVYDQDSRQYRLCAATSTDGSSWNVSVIWASTNQTYRNAVWSGARFLVLLDIYDADARIYRWSLATSPDGVGWTLRDLGAVSRFIKLVTDGKKRALLAIDDRIMEIRADDTIVNRASPGAGIADLFLFARR